MKLIAGLAIALAVAGCGLNPEYRAARYAEREAQQVERCRSFGAGPETANYAQCRMMLFQQASQASAAQGQVLQAIGAQLINPPRQPISQSTSCTTTRFGNQLRTSCW